MKFIMKNCNNIDHGELVIKKEYLNIKYATNGTGKSTISKAIDCLIQGKLQELTPFKHYDEKESGSLSPEHEPSLEIYANCQADGAFDFSCCPIKTIKVFDEPYVDKYTFIGDDVVSDGFEIFVKTPDYEERLREIDGLIDEIRAFFRENSELDTVIQQFDSFINKIVKPGTRVAISTTSLLHKALNAGNKTIVLPDEYAGYRTYITSSVGGKWAKWQKEGLEYFDSDDSGNCPFCSDAVDLSQEPVIRGLSEQFSSSYLNDLKTVQESLGLIKEYFNPEVKLRIEALGESPTGFSQNEKDLITSVCNCVKALQTRLQNARNVSFNSLKTAADIIASFTDNLIDLNVYPELNSEKTKVIVRGLNESITSTLEKATELQVAISAQNNLVRETIEKNEGYINEFLKNAGYQYEVVIRENEEPGKYRMLLRASTADVVISNIKTHLSYGEKNAFALVLFMFDAIREKPDLIVLDDPISSFDKHKKYAIMDMLFCRERATLRGLTTLLLTHDFEPISDVLKVHDKAFTWKASDGKRGQFVQAYFLRNEYDEDGVSRLSEKRVLGEHVLSYMKILQSNCSQGESLISKLIYLRRLKELEGDKGDVWQVLSSFFHKDTPKPVARDEEIGAYVEMDEDSVLSAQLCIGDLISKPFSYETAYIEFWNPPRLVNMYHSCSNSYEKLQIFRCLSETIDEVRSEMSDEVFAKFINETYHSEMDYILQLNPVEFEMVPHHILHRCSAIVSNLPELPDTV